MTGPAGSHVYWRLNIVAAASEPGVSELIFAATQGGSTQTTGGTVLASSSYSGYPASNAFDGNTGTTWYAASGTTGWIGYQFASAVSVAEVRLNYTGSGGDCPTSITVDYSDDGSTWTSAFAVGNIAAFSGTVTFENPALMTPVTGGHAFWRAYFPTSQSNSYVDIADIIFATTVSGSQAATGGNIIFASAYSSYPASNAFDGNSSTQWTSAGAPPSWIGYEFVSALVDIVEVRITAGSDTADAPASLDIQYSDDGITWTTAGAFGSIGAWSSGQTNTYDLSSRGSTEVIADQVARETLVITVASVYADGLGREVLAQGNSTVYADIVEREVLSYGTGVIYTDMLVREILLVPHTGVFVDSLVREILTNKPTSTYSDSISDGNATPSDSYVISGNVYGFTITEAANAHDSVTPTPGSSPKLVYTPVPLSQSNWYPWAQQMARAINRTQAGGQNTTFTTITLQPNSATTTLTDPRIGANSVIQLQPMTATAAAEQWYITNQQVGSATINHSNSADTTRTYRVNIVA